MLVVATEEKRVEELTEQFTDACMAASVLMSVESTKPVDPSFSNSASNEALNAMSSIVAISFSTLLSTSFTRDNVELSTVESKDVNDGCGGPLIILLAMMVLLMMRMMVTQMYSTKEDTTSHVHK